MFARGLVVDVFRRQRVNIFMKNFNSRCFPLGGSTHIYDILCLTIIIFKYLIKIC